MAAIVYFLCAATSLLCAGLLLAGWRRAPARLLMWVALGFIGLAVNNLLLFVDHVIVENVDLQVARDISGLVAVSVLLFGLVWESR